MRLIAEITLRSPSGVAEILGVTTAAAGSVELEVAPGVYRPYWPMGDRLLNLDRTLGLFGDGRATRAEVSLRELGGRLKALELHRWDSVRVLEGPSARFAPYAAFRPLLDGRVVDLLRGETGISLVVRGARWAWEQPWPWSLYSGTGGLNGDPEMAGRPRPVVLGDCRMVEPLLIGRQLGLYQWTHRDQGVGPIESLTVTEGGEARPIQNVSWLQIVDPGAQPPPGVVWSAPDRGLLRPGFAVNRPLRVTVTRPVGASVGSSPTIPSVMFRLQPSDGLFNHFQPDSLNLFGRVGVVVKGTAADEADTVMASVGGGWAHVPLWAETPVQRAIFSVFSRNQNGFVVPTQRIGGSFALSRLLETKPGRTTSFQAFPAADLRVLPGSPLPGWPTVPVWRLEVTWGRNWAPLRDNEIFGSVGEVERAALTAPHLGVAVWQEPAVAAAWPESPVLRLDTVLFDEAAAQAVANRLGPVYSTPVSWGRILIPPRFQPWLLAPGDVLTIDGHRWLVHAVGTDDGRVWEAQAVRLLGATVVT